MITIMLYLNNQEDETGKMMRQHQDGNQLKFQEWKKPACIMTTEAEFHIDKEHLRYR